MENAQTDNSAACGQSRSTVGLGVDLPPGCDFTFHMSNAELAEAIDAAYQRVSKTGQMFDHYPVLQRHLADLLAIQRARAGMIETPNVEVQRDSGSIIAGGSAGTTGSAAGDDK